MLKTCLYRFVLPLLLALALAGAARADDRGALVFAAASMSDALQAAADSYAEAAEAKPRFSFASSAVLARQIAQGAPADLYVSANEEWMAFLVDEGAVESGAPVNIAGNAIVIAGPEGSAPAEDAAAALGTGRFAMGDPEHVPAGIYGRAALESLGVWADVSQNGVFGENVRVALELASRGEVERTIVYASDLVAAPDLATIYTFPSDSHAPIFYPAAVPENAPEPEEGTAFLTFLQSEKGQAILQQYGFTAP